MSDLEIDTARAETGVKTLTLQVGLGDLKTNGQVVRQDRERHIIGQPKPSDLDKFSLGNARCLDGVVNVLNHGAGGEFQQPRTRSLASFDDVLVEAAERFGPTELRPYDLSANPSFAHQQSLID